MSPSGASSTLWIAAGEMGSTVISGLLRAQSSRNQALVYRRLTCDDRSATPKPGHATRDSIARNRGEKAASDDVPVKRESDETSGCLGRLVGGSSYR